MQDLEVDQNCCGMRVDGNLRDVHLYREDILVFHHFHFIRDTR